MFPSSQPPNPQPQLNPAILAALASLLNGSRTMVPGHLPEQPAPGLSPLAQAAAGNDPAGGYMPPPDQIGQVAAGLPPVGGGGPLYPLTPPPRPADLYTRVETHRARQAHPSSGGLHAGGGPSGVPQSGFYTPQTAPAWLLAAVKNLRQTHRGIRLA